MFILETNNSTICAKLKSTKFELQQSCSAVGIRWTFEKYYGILDKICGGLAEAQWTVYNEMD